MLDKLPELILTLTPADGSLIGNAALLKKVREQVPALTEKGYTAARNALIDQGMLGRGRGRGGSVFRIAEAQEAEEGSERAGDKEGFELTQPEPLPTSQTKSSAKQKRKPARQAGSQVQVLSYRHDDKRVNNPCSNGN